MVEEVWHFVQFYGMGQCNNIHNSVLTHYLFLKSSTYLSIYSGLVNELDRLGGRGGGWKMTSERWDWESGRED